MGLAQGDEVVQAGGAAPAPGGEVVDVAALGGGLAGGEDAGSVAGAYQVGQADRGPVTGPAHIQDDSADRVGDQTPPRPARGQGPGGQRRHCHAPGPDPHLGNLSGLCECGGVLSRRDGAGGEFGGSDGLSRCGALRSGNVLSASRQTPPTSGGRTAATGRGRTSPAGTGRTRPSGISARSIPGILGEVLVPLAVSRIIASRITASRAAAGAATSEVRRRGQTRRIGRIVQTGWAGQAGDGDGDLDVDADVLGQGRATGGRGRPPRTGRPHQAAQGAQESFQGYPVRQQPPRARASRGATLVIGCRLCSAAASATAVTETTDS